MKREKFVLAIPSYEPDERLLSYLQVLKEHGICNIVVVDDGSSERAKMIFRQIEDSVTVLVNDRNCGKGFSLKKAFQYILEQYGEEVSIITVDCDGQHQVFDVLNIMERYEEGTLLLGMRNFSEKGVPLHRRFSNQLTTYLFQKLYHCSVTDTQTGLRAFSATLLSDFIELSGDHFEYEMNVLKYCVQNGIPIIEVPIQTIYFRGNGVSHFKPFRDSLAIYRNMFHR